MTVINSPFRYPGGKFYARKLILQHIPPHSYYVEPFAGGASIFFAKTKVPMNWLNDADPELINVYLHIRDHVQALIDFLDGLPATKELHSYYKNEFKPQNALERAGRWYYLNRTSYSGIMKDVNCYWGYGPEYSMRPENWPDNLRRTSKKLADVRITNWDFEQVLENAVDNSFLFVDPPYFNADQDKFYNISFSKEEHFRLSSVLERHSHRLNYLITYDNSREIRDLYAWATDMYDREWNYTINRTDDQKNGTSQKGSRYKGKEVFIVNYQYAVPEQLSLLG
ncbi:MAG: DNA adenine methylase [Chloroflexi bacterium]|nr:DNA adenine methylase [Chloroflexota bacterium]MBP8056296.1 DNA adenine methylase [Chloroflexota bacterium]